MRMRRKKNLDSRMEVCAERVTNILVKDRRFDADSAETMLDYTALFGNDNPVHLEIGCGL